MTEESDSKELELAKRTSEKLIQVTALILTVNLGISISGIEKTVLNSIKYPITISSISFLLSIILGVILSGSVIQRFGPDKNDSASRDRILKYSRLQF